MLITMSDAAHYTSGYPYQTLQVVQRRPAMVKLLITTICIGLLIFITYSVTPGVFHLVSDEAQQMNGGAMGNLSLPYVVREYTMDLTEREAVAEQQAIKIESAKIDRTEKARILAADEAKLRQTGIFIQRSREWVNTHAPDDTCSIGGSTHSYSDMTEDVAVRMKAREDLERSVYVLKGAINQVDNILRDEEISLRKMRRDLQTQRERVRILGPVLLMWEDLKGWIRDTESSISNQTGNEPSPFKQLFGDRVKAMEAEITVINGSNFGHDPVRGVRYPDEGMAVGFINEEVLSATPAR